MLFQMFTKSFVTAALTQPVPGPLGPTIDLFLASLAIQGKAERTLYGYHRELTLLSQAIPFPIEDVGYAEIMIFYKLRFSTPGAKGTRNAGKPIGQYTQRKIMAFVGNFFRWTHDRGLTKEGKNPHAGIGRPAAPDPEPTAWSISEVLAILRVELPPRNHLLLETLARHGQRISPVCSLTWDRIILDPQRPEIRYGRAKGNALHTLPMPDELYHDFTAYKSMVHPPTDADFVFKSNQGKGLSNSQADRIIEKACRLAHVPKPWTAHQFRRSAITNLLDAGVDLATVSKGVAGHKDVSTTIKHYKQVTAEGVKTAINGLY